MKIQIFIVKAGEKKNEHIQVLNLYLGYHHYK